LLVRLLYRSKKRAI